MRGDRRVPSASLAFARLAILMLAGVALAACAVRATADRAGGAGEAAPSAVRGGGDARTGGGEAASEQAYPGARSYSGTYSCDGCVERRLTVTIFADGSHRLRELPAAGQPIHEQGRWSVPADAPDRIVLESSDGTRVLRRSAPDELTIVDPEGRELHGLIGGVLVRMPAVDPLSVSQRLVGVYRRVGAQRILVDCATGRSFPVRAHAALDAAWTALAPHEDETVLVVVRAHRAGSASRVADAGGEAIVVDAFERATRNGRCEGEATQSSGR